MKERDDFTILFMGTYPPRECGIATFTKDLVSSIDKRFSPKIKSKILAINKNGSNIYNYNKKVLFQISDNDINDYIEVAKKINLSEEIKLIIIQHEFGIFGGEYGDHLLAFLEVIEKPVIITFHSILPDPNERLKKVVRAIGEKVESIVVMTKKGVDILREDYDVQAQIKIIPHGIPNVRFESQIKEKRNLGFNNNIILSSFGLMNRGKGYEYVIEALPDVVKKYPKLLYLIVGETHPVVRKNEGEEYRNFLEKRVRELGLEKHVKFYNKYLDLNEIIKYLKASDIYVSSGLDPNQITSGTLSYAMGCGRVVVSTPFLHAKDCLKNDVGVLADFRNPKSYSIAIKKILDDLEFKGEMERNAYIKTRHMTWSNVSLSYGRLFKEILNIQNIPNLPRLDYSHLFRMTDNFGIIQFAREHIPDYESGYSLDDNARALIVCSLHYSHFKEYKILKLLKVYLDYIKYVQDSDGKLYNYVDKNKNVNYDDWSEDAHGRAIWSLGVMLKTQLIPEDFKEDINKILKKSMPTVMKMQSPRSIAFSLIGLCNSQEDGSNDYKEQIKKLADWLVSAYKANSHEDWPWFEPYLTYSNSKLSESLFLAYLATNNEEYLKIAKSSLKFLMKKTFYNSIFVPIGQENWYVKGQVRSYYDQQPIEASYMVQTLLVAYKITKDPYYKNKALDVFQWFLGKNTLNQVLYNESTGGCHDGLGKYSININQGAESTLSYLIARLSLKEIF